MSKNPNPQGKGNLPVLAALTESRRAVATVPPKRVEQVSTELFTSLFVLASDFRFRPVPGRPYWMYRKPGRFWLALSPPEQVSEDVYGRYIGRCELQPDMTWTLELSEAAAADPEFLALLEARRAQLDSELEGVGTLDEILPKFRGEMPFYQRVFAYALAHSLGISMDRSGIRDLTYEQALGALTYDGDEHDGEGSSGHD